MNLGAQPLQATDELVRHDLVFPLVQVPISQILVHFLAGKHVRDTDENRVGHSNEGSFAPSSIGVKLREERMSLGKREEDKAMLM